MSTTSESLLKPSLIPHFKKQNFLKALSEDEFRDRVVRPLYILKGLVHGKDLCGPDEEGKDCYFFGNDPVRSRILFAIQTKKGDLKMTRHAHENIVTALTQLRTALATTVKDAVTRQTYRPDCVVLVASGEINRPARDHITDEVKDTRIFFVDADTLIPEIDHLMPELWLGIDANTLPYLKALRDELIRQSDTIDISQLGIGEDVASPITDDTYAQLYLHRLNPSAERMGGVKRTKLLEELPVQEVLKRPERLILMTGDAGSGKTTSLRRLALILVQEALLSGKATAIPVFLRATEVARGGGKLAEIAALAAKRLTPESAHCFSRTELDEGNVAVLLDGYDELASDELRDALVDRVAEFHATFPKCRVILTSRDSSYANKLPDRIPFLRFTISPINLQQTEKIVRRLSRGQALEPQMAQELLRRLDNIHGMELNPLLVTVFVATSDYSRQDIPANITELFKKFTEMMLGRWDSNKGLAQQYQAPLKDFLLSRVAFQMHEARVTSWPLSRWREVIERELRERGYDADVGVLSRELLQRSGLLVVQDDDVRFRHLLIQEFFAGRGIPSAEFLASVIDDPWWTKAVVFHFGEKPDNHKDLEAVVSRMEDGGDRNLYPAAVSVGLALQACYLTKLADKTSLLRWVVQALASKKLEMAGGANADDCPLMQVLMYYIVARDAVGGKSIAAVARDVFAGAGFVAAGFDADEEEVSKFWCIAGLIEAGELELAEGYLKGFNPRDMRLLLCLHLGCYYVWKLRIAPADHRKVAERICEKLTPAVSHFQGRLLKEVRGLLLEIRGDSVEAIDKPDEGEA